MDTVSMTLSLPQAWGCFLPVWNGSGLMYSVVGREPQVVLTSDASVLWEYGGLYGGVSRCVTGVTM